MVSYTFLIWISCISTKKNGRPVLKPRQYSGICVVENNISLSSVIQANILYDIYFYCSNENCEVVPVTGHSSKRIN